jgi:hypothetical protein
MSERISEYIIDRVLEKKREDMPNRMSARISEGRSADMRDRMSEDMSDRLSEDMLEIRDRWRK